METIGLRAGSKRKVLTPRRLTKKSQRKRSGQQLDLRLLRKDPIKVAQLLEHRTFVSESRPVIQEQIT
jgi:hypothetical protein